MNQEFSPMDPALEQAVTEIRNDSVDPAVVEAAAARVWQTLAAQIPGHIRNCADFQALIPDYRAGRLPAARATLLQDHLHECVACRHVYEGNVVPMPAVRPQRRTAFPMRWAVAAVVVMAAGASLWIAVDRFGNRTGRAYIQAVNGTLYEITGNDIRPLAAGQDLPSGVEIRTAKDSDAMLALADGSQVELRERSGLSTFQTGKDLTIHLERGSIIVQAARRRSSHLYVATADYRVAVTGTVFSVNAGVKGSRVSVIQGEVHISQENHEQVLHPGDQAVSSPNLEPVSIPDDIAWSRNRDALLKQLQALRSDLQQLHLPGPRYSSKLLGRLPASTIFYASVPNLGQYLTDVQSIFRKKLADSPELRTFLGAKAQELEPVLDQLRTASAYLGDEIVVDGFAGPDGRVQGPVFFAETTRPGFPEFLRGLPLPLAVETRNGLVAFGLDRDAVQTFAPALDNPAGGFQATPFYSRINEVYRGGAGLMFCADLTRMGHQQEASQLGGANYFIFEQKEVAGNTETRANIGFTGERTGIAGWLAEPAPMGALDYVSPDATLVFAFVVKSPGAIVNQLTTLTRTSPDAVAGFDPSRDLAPGLGGEFALALDGPAFPVPSWKLVTEVYDPNRVEAGLQKLVAAYGQKAAAQGDKPLRTSQEVIDGRTWYTIASAIPSPLLEAHYTFDDGYLIAGPTKDVVSRALQAKRAGTSITRASKFVEMAPRDHYTNFSGVFYENLGTTLAPLAGLAGMFLPRGTGQQGTFQGLDNLKPMFIGAYAAPDHITIAANGDSFGMSLPNLLSGNFMNMTGLPFGHFEGTRRP